MTHTTALDPATFALSATIQDEADTTSADFDLAPALDRMSDYALSALALQDLTRTDYADFLAEDIAEDATPNGAAVREFYATFPDTQPRTREANGSDVTWDQEELLNYLERTRPSMSAFLKAVRAWEDGSGTVDPETLTGTLNTEVPADHRVPVTQFTLTITRTGDEDEEALRKLLETAGYAVMDLTARTQYAAPDAQSPRSGDTLNS